MKKKIALVVMSAVLLCAVVAMSTVAYLTAKSNGGSAVVNTFTTAGLIDPPVNPGDSNFKLYETTGTDYTVIPGVAITKDPVIEIDNKTETAAYLFVEIVETANFTNGKLSYATTNSWVETTATGKNGGTVYVYTTAITDANNTETDVFKAQILKENKVNVATDYVGGTQPDTLSFYGYLCQVGGFEVDANNTAMDTIAEAGAVAFNACFA